MYDFLGNFSSVKRTLAGMLQCDILCRDKSVTHHDKWWYVELIINDLQPSV